nr:glycosyltransferase family 2 protein [Paenibacillus hamazuiensis]
MATVTVLLPVFNGIPYIEEAIISVLSQTFTDFEFLLIDDGSRDGTLQLLQGWQARDGRIKVVVHETNRGLIASLNEGLSLATGKYIARMDADDVCLPHRLQRQVEFMEAHPEIGVCGGQASYTGTGRITTNPLDHEQIKCFQLFWCAFTHPSVMMRKSVLDQYGIRYQPYPHAEDYDLWNRLAKVCGLVNLPDVLVVKRDHPAQVSVAHKPLQDHVANLIRIEQLRELGIEPTPEEFSIHLDFASYRIKVHDPVMHAKAALWAHKIMDANAGRGIYHPQKLKDFLGECFQISARLQQ